MQLFNFNALNAETILEATSSCSTGFAGDLLETRVYMFPVTPSHWPCFPKATCYFQFRYALDAASLVLRRLLLLPDPAFEPFGLGVSPDCAFGETHRSVGSAPVSSSFSRLHVLFLSVAFTSPSRTTAQNMDPVMMAYTIGVDRDELSSSSDVTLVAWTTVYAIGDAV